MTWAFFESLIYVVGGLLALWRYWLNYEENKKIAEAKQKDDERRAALEKLRQAVNEKEIDEALDGIIDNKP